MVHAPGVRYELSTSTAVSLFSGDPDVGKRADMQCVRKQTERSKSQELLHNEQSPNITSVNLRLLGRIAFIPVQTWDAVCCY